MEIYYFMFEGIPSSDSPDKDECAGAFINCWVDSTDMNSALTKANNYINDEGWIVLSIEEQCMANRNDYEGDSELEESLECFDEALTEGISAIFNIWTYDD